MPESTLVEAIMTREVTTLSPDAPLLDAARLLFDNRWAGAPVVAGGRVVGVLSLADVIARERSVHAPTPLILFDALLYLGSKRFARELTKVTAMTVGDAMSSPAITATPQTSVADLVGQMLDRGLTTMPIVDGETLVGVVGRRDVVRLILAREDGGGRSPSGT